MHSVHILKEAWSFYTGHPPSLQGKNGEGWQQVLKTLDENGWTPWEYLYWCVHHLGGGYHPEVLQKVGWIIHPDTVGEFKAWKGKQSVLLPDIVKKQRVKYRMRKENLKPRILLEDRLFDLDPPVRCDLAVRDMEDPSPVLNRYEETAVYMVRGMREYLPLLKHWRKYV